MTETFAECPGRAAAPLTGVAAALLAVLLAGCAGGLIGPLPGVTRPQEASTVTIFRGASLPGFLGPMVLSIDGCPTFRFWNNQEYSFQLDPGQYIFDYTIGFNECRRVAFIEPGRSYRYNLQPNCVGFNDGCMAIGGAAPASYGHRPPAIGPDRRNCGGFNDGCN